MPRVSRQVWLDFKRAVDAITKNRCAEGNENADRVLKQNPDSGEYLEGNYVKGYYAHFLRGLVLLHCRYDTEGADREFQVEAKLGRIGKDMDWATRFSQELAQVRRADDTEPPVIRIDRIEVVETRFRGDQGREYEEALIRLKGIALDSGSGVKAILVDGHSIAFSASASEPGVCDIDDDTVPIRIDRANQQVRVIVTDQRDNRTEVDLPLELPPLRIDSPQAIHAIVVGVDAYDGSYRDVTGACRPELRQTCQDPSQFVCHFLPPLAAAAADAERFAGFLRRRGVPESNVRLLVSRPGAMRATRSRVLAAIDEVMKVRGRKLIFYFAGHGVLSKREENLMLVSDTKAMECADAPPRVQTDLERTSLGVNQVKELLAKTRFDERYLILDACRTTVNNRGSTPKNLSPGFETRRLPGVPPGEIDEEKDTDSPVVVFYGTSEKRVSVEWTEQRAGYFTYFLVQGLRRNLSLRDLEAFVFDRVSRMTAHAAGCADGASPANCEAMQLPVLDSPRSLRAQGLEPSTFILGDKVVARQQ